MVLGGELEGGFSQSFWGYFGVNQAAEPLLVLFGGEGALRPRRKSHLLVALSFGAS